MSKMPCGGVLSSSTPNKDDYLPGGKCSECKAQIDQRKDEFACGQCQKWPLCGRCTLVEHLNHERKFNVKEQFEHRLAEFESWWLETGAASYESIRLLEERVNKAIKSFDHYRKISPCCNDLIFSCVLGQRREDLRAKFQPYRQLITETHNYQEVVDIMHSYLTSHRPEAGLYELAICPHPKAYNRSQLMAAYLELKPSSRYRVAPSRILNALEMLERVTKMLRASIPADYQPWSTSNSFMPPGGPRSSMILRMRSQSAADSKMTK